MCESQSPRCRHGSPSCALGRTGEGHRRLGAPLCRGIARIRREDRHERQQQGFDDRQPPIVPVGPWSMAVCFLCSAISLPTSPGDSPSGTAHPFRFPLHEASCCVRAPGEPAISSPITRLGAPPGPTSPETDETNAQLRPLSGGAAINKIRRCSPPGQGDLQSGLGVPLPLLLCQDGVGVIVWFGMGAGA